MDQFRFCYFCGGNAAEPDHELHCDGKQGGSEDIPRFRDSSITAFYNAVASGVIRTRQQQAWIGLQTTGRATHNEVIQYLQRECRITAKSHSLTPRFSELRDAGLIREVGERICTVTGELCVVLEVVPSEEYQPLPVLKHRCSTCGQLIRRTQKKPAA